MALKGKTRQPSSRSVHDRDRMKKFVGDFSRLFVAMVTQTSRLPKTVTRIIRASTPPSATVSTALLPSSSPVLLPGTDVIFDGDDVIVVMVTNLR
jgi:hypothetical protein